MYLFQWTTDATKTNFLKEVMEWNSQDFENVQKINVNWKLTSCIVTKYISTSEVFFNTHNQIAARME